MNRERNCALDVIRIVAAIGIVFLHYQQKLVGGGMYIGKVWIDAEEGNYIHFRYGVEVFFVLSGYLQYVYVKRIRDGLRFWEYIKKKLIRILPLLVITTIVYSGLFYINTENSIKVWDDTYYPNLWGILTQMLGLAQMWCFSGNGIMRLAWYVDGLLLCFVIMYYLVRLADRTRIHENYFFLLMVIFGCCIIQHAPEIPFLTTGSGRAYSSFFAGVILAAYVGSREIAFRHYAAAGLIVLIFFGALIVYPDFLAYGQNYVIAFLLTPACILLAESKAAKKIFSWRGFGAAGSWTYSVYLWHMPLMLILMDVLSWRGLRIDYSQPVVFFSFVILVFIFGAVSYYGIECPIRWIFEKREAEKKREKEPVQ